MNPYSWVLLGLLGITLWLLIRKQILPAVGILILDIFLCVMSLPDVTTALGYALEKRYPPTAMEAIPQADAIVLLGGGIGATNTVVPYPECYPAADRAVMAARLWHAKKAPVIIPTGEGALTAEKPILETMGVAPEAIVCEYEARNTAENASKTFEILRARGAKKVLVVTSAWHLPRSMMLFREEGMEFIPVGCDYECTLALFRETKMPLWQRLPNAASAGWFSVYLKELLGITYYAIRAK